MSSATRTPTRPPADLSKPSKKWWRACISTFEFQTPDLAILEEACRALDRALEARAQVERDGVFIQTHVGLKQHPGILLERDSITLWSRLVRDLHLPSAPDVPKDALASAMARKNGNGHA